MPKYDNRKLETLMNNIRRYLQKHDIDYKERRKKENIDTNFKQSVVKQLASQNEKLLEKLNLSIVGLKGKLDIALLDKKLGSKVEELKKEVASIEMPKPYKPEVVSPLLKRIENSINNIKIPIQQFPKETSFKEAKDLDKRLKDLIIAVKKIKSSSEVKVDISGVEKAVEKLGKKLDKIKTPKFEIPETMNVHSVDPVYKPTPATHISINSLSGTVHTTSTTVKTTLTKLPGYGVLDNRRSLVFQNVSASTDVYIGGSDVTTDNGYKVEAGSTSPAFDSGPLQKWYGVTSSGTADIRCIEIPDEASGR